MPFWVKDGFQMHYATAGDWQKSQDTLLLIHGLGSSIRDWEYQLPALEPHFKILMVDLRGHGQTDKPNMPYTISLMSEDVISLIRHLQCGPLHLVGHSMGGMIAFQLALDYSDMVKTLTIINSAPQVAFPSFRSRLNFGLRALSVKWFGMKKLSVSLAKAVFPKPGQAALRDVFIERWCENSPQAYLNSLKAFHDWNVMIRLPDLHCPVLIISGDRDYTPVAYKQFYVQLIKNAELVVIEDSGHLTIIDQAQKCNQAIIDFLLKNKDPK
jgi:3-oxoadipate enol-lactonase